MGQISLSQAEEAKHGHDHDDQADDVDDGMHGVSSEIASGNSDTGAKVASLAEISGRTARRMRRSEVHISSISVRGVRP
jgi:hypothetical protein